MDEEAKAELLTFLIVGQFLAYARSGERMRTDHLIESCQIWLSSNGARCDWLDRGKLIEACMQSFQRRVRPLSERQVLADPGQRRFSRRKLISVSPSHRRPKGRAALRFPHAPLRDSFPAWSREPPLWQRAGPP